MHELAICEALLRQVLDLVASDRVMSRDAPGISRITLRIGPLAGVEPEQLRRAFPLVAAGTACAGASIEIEGMPVEVLCRICAEVSQVPANRLLCMACGAWRVKLVSGDEMLLAGIEFNAPPLYVDGNRADV